MLQEANRSTADLRAVLWNFWQLLAITWAVDAHADRSAILTYPLSVKGMQLRFSLRIEEKL
jgi:hypothetical protein